MPKGKSKGKKGKGGKKKGKKDKKKKEIPEGPPLHELTTLYNELIEAIEEFRVVQNRARKKRIEAWYMTREMMSLKHDNEVYNNYLKEKMEEVERLLKEIMAQLQKERDEVEKIIAERLEQLNKLLADFRARAAKAEAVLQDLKLKLQEYEHLMRELAALLAKLKELQGLVPIYELEANIKTRHLKNQYLHERAQLHNHLEDELFLLINTCRAHLMPILADHMNAMELENRCNRWDLGNLDMENFRLYRERETLLEKRNRLNMEREYLSIDWAFNKLTQVDIHRKELGNAIRHKKAKSRQEDDCELAIAFRSYLSKKLAEIDKVKANEVKAKLRWEAKQKRLRLEMEKKKREAYLVAKRAQAARQKATADGNLRELDSEEEEWEDENFEDEWDELEYYEDEDGNLVFATPSRMLQHKAILENKALAEVEQQVEDINRMIAKEKEA